MQSSVIEFAFLKSSIEQFIKNLHDLQDVIEDKVFSENEMLEIMHCVVAVRENVELIEKKYLSAYVA